MRSKSGSFAVLVLLAASCSAPEPPKPSAEKQDGADQLVSLTSANFKNEVLRHTQPVLVDVGAPG